MRKIKLVGNTKEAENTLRGFDCKVYINDELVNVSNVMVEGEPNKPIKVTLEFYPHEIELDLENLYTDL